MKCQTCSEGIVFYHLINGSKDWSTKHDNKPLFDIMSTVKKSQKRECPPSKDIPFSIYQPINPSVDDICDKENIPVSYKTQFSKPTSLPKETDHHSRPSVVADVDTNDEGSITNEESEYIRQLLSSQSQKSSISTANRISDVDDSASFMTGRRDTADMKLLLGIQELFDKATDTQLPNS